MSQPFDEVVILENEQDHAQQNSRDYQPIPLNQNRANVVYPQNDFIDLSQHDYESLAHKPDDTQLLFQDFNGDMKVNNQVLTGAEQELKVWLKDFTNQPGSKRELSKKEQQEAIVSGVYFGMIFLRRISRLILSFILLAFTVGFFAWGYFVSLESSTWDSKKSFDTVKVKSRNCLINITESQDNVKFDYIAKGSLFKHVNASEAYRVSGEEQEDGSLALNFINPFTDMTNCLIDLHLPRVLKSFEFLCLNESECIVVSHMESFTTQELFNISVEERSFMEVNYKDLRTNELTFKTTSAANVILNHVIANSANIQILAGDVVLQSSEDYQIDFTSTGHSFCMSAPLLNQQLTDCYLDEGTIANKQNQLTCSGNVKICAPGSCQPTQKYKITLSSATMYANRLKSIGKPYIHQIDSVNILKSGKFSGTIEFDGETKNRIKEFQSKIVSDADFTIRIDVGGSLFLQSPANSYWAYFSNPSYANFDPWWISVFSATLLSAQFKKITASLEPGFCPWYPTSPTVGQLYELQQYMNTYMNKTYGKVIYLNKDNRPIPEDTLSSDASYFGTEVLTSKQKNRYEKWYTIERTADIVDFKTLPYDQFFVAAIAVSLTSSALFGIMAVFALVILLQAVEAYILQTTSQFQFYSATSQQETQEKLNTAAKLMISKLDQLASKKDPPILQGIFTYLWYLVGQSITKDSAKMFCETFFKKSDQEQTTKFHNQQLEDKYLRIDESKLKETYEQFCFINQMRIDQISQQEKLLEYYGFEIGEKGESIMLCKLKFKPGRKPYNQLSENEKTNGDSLELFMQTQILITGIPADTIESAWLESEYIKFCGKVLLKKPFNAKDLANDYSLAISDQKVYEVRKVRTGNQVKQNLLVRFLGRCTHYLPLIEDYHEQPPTFILNMDSESNQFLTNPINTLSNHHKQISDNFWQFNTLRMIIESFRFNYKQRIFNRPYYFGGDRNFVRDSFDVLYMRGWITSDFVIVAGNMIITAISILPVAFFLMIVNTSYSPLSIYNPKTLMYSNDILQRPWSVFQYQYQVDQWVLGGAILILYYGAMTFLCQSIKYLLTYFPEEIGFMLEFKLYQIRVLKYFNAFQYYQFLLLMFAVFTYFGLVIVWLILGAIINPNNYLVYSSCAATLVATISAEYSAIKELYQQACEEVKKLIMEIYLRTFGQLASNLIKEVQRLQDNTANIVNSSGMHEAKDMAEQLGFGEELSELCVLTQNMLDTNSANSLEMDQLNFKAIKDKFIQKACEKFIKIARDQFQVKDIIAEQLVKANFLKFEEIIDPLANQVQITSGNKIPSSLVKWLYQTIVTLNRVFSKKTAEEQRKEMKSALPKITFSLFDAVINGIMLKVTIDDKGASQEALKSIINCMFSITQDKNAMNILKQIRLLFTNLKDQADVNSTPLQILELAFNYAEALNDPSINVDSTQSEMIKQLLKIFKVDTDVSNVFLFLFLGQRQFVEKGQVMTATEIAGLLIRIQETYFKYDSQDEKKKTFDLLVLACVKFIKNDRLPVQEMLGLLVPDSHTEQVNQVFENNKKWINIMLSVFILASKNWRKILQLEDKEQNSEYIKDLLLLGTKSLWTSEFIEKKVELSKSEDLKEGKDWDQKYFRRAAAKPEERVQKLVNSELVEQISHMLGIDQPSTIGLILFLRGENLDSEYFSDFCLAILKFVDKDMKSTSEHIKTMLQIYSCRTFEDFHAIFTGDKANANSELAKAYTNLVFSSPTTFKIFNGQRLIDEKEKKKENLPPKQRYEQLLSHLANAAEKDEFLKKIQACLPENQLQPTPIDSDDSDVINYYKSERVNFLTYLRKSIKGEEASKKEKAEMAKVIRNMYNIKHDYLQMLVELQQNLYAGQSLNLNLLQGLKVEPFRALLQIMTFKDAVQVCTGLKYFLDGNPSIQVNLQTIQLGIQTFVEIEQLLAAIDVPTQLPFYFYKLIPVAINNLLGTRSRISDCLYFDCINLVYKHGNLIGLDEANQQATANYMCMLFEKNQVKRQAAIYKGMKQLSFHNQIKVTSLQESKLKQISEYMIALAEKDYGKLLGNLANYFKNIDPPEFRTFFQKVAQIIRGFSSIAKAQDKISDSDDTKNLVWACQQLKYFITYDKNAFQDLIVGYLERFAGREKVNLDAFSALFTLFTDQPDVRSIVQYFQIGEEFVQLSRFLVYAIMSDKKSALLQDPTMQEIIEKRLKVSSLLVLIELSDLIEQNIKEIPKLMSRLSLDSNPIIQKVFSAFIYFRLQFKSTGTWNINVARYDEFFQKRKVIYNENLNVIQNPDIAELLLWFASPRPLNFLYQQNQQNQQNIFVTDNVSYLFAAIAAFAKYDYHDRYANRQPEYIKHKMNKVASLSAKSDEKALLFIAESCEQDLIEGYLMLQMATGINPVLIGAIMGNQSCHNDILQSQIVQTQELLSKALQRFDDYETFDVFERLYVIEYEFAKMAIAVEFEGKAQLMKKVEGAQKNISKLLMVNGKPDTLEILSKFISDCSRGDMQKYCPLSSLILIHSLKHLRQAKKDKSSKLAQYLKSVHLIDMVFTIFERYSYFFEPEQLQMINKPVLTRLLSFGLFDSKVLRSSNFNQQLLEGLLYPGISDPFMSEKYGIRASLIEGVKKSSNATERTARAKHYFEILSDLEIIFVPIEDGQMKKRGKVAECCRFWSTVMTERAEPNMNAVNLLVGSAPDNNKIGEHYHNLFSRLPADPKNLQMENALKLQAKRVADLQSINFQQVGFLRTKYLDKSITLLKRFLLKPSEVEMMNSDQITEQKELLIVNLISLYACQYSLEDKQHQAQVPSQNAPGQPLSKSSDPNILKLFTVNQQAYNQVKYNKAKNKQLISRTHLIDAILSLQMNEQEKDACKFLVQLLYDPRRLKEEDFKFLWDNQEKKVTGLIMMMIRMQLEYSKQEGRFTQLANSVPSCYLYYSIGDQYESTQDLSVYKTNNQKLNGGMEELLSDCNEIDPKLKTPLKLLIRCYLGDVEAWYALIAFSRKQTNFENGLLSETMIHIFIVELLSYLKNLGLRNPKLSKGQVASQSFLQLLSSSPEFNLKSSLELVLMKTFKLSIEEKDIRFKPGSDSKLVKLQKANIISKNFVKYLDFIIDGNIEVLKGDLLPILRGMFDIKIQDDWDKLSKPMQLIMQMLFKGCCPNENFSIYEAQIKHSLNTAPVAWKLIKIVIEAHHCNDLKIFAKKLLEFTETYDIPQLKPYVHAMIGFNLALNIKHLANNKEMIKAPDMMDLIMTPICWVNSLNQPEIYTGDIDHLKTSVEFCKKFIQSKQSSDIQIVAQSLQLIDYIEVSDRNKEMQLFTAKNLLFLSEVLVNWCVQNQDSKFYIIVKAIAEILSFQRLPKIAEVIAVVLIGIIFEEDLEFNQKQFINELTKDFSEFAEQIQAATIGFSKIKSVSDINSEGFTDAVVKLLGGPQGFGKLAKILLGIYKQQEDQKNLQQLPIIIQELCFVGEQYKGKFSSIPLDQLFAIAEAALKFIAVIENSKDVDELKLIQNVKTVFEPMFKEDEKNKNEQQNNGDQKFQLSDLISSLEAFIAIKNKRFHEINSTFFKVMGLSPSNSQLLVKLMQDFQLGLQSPQKMIQQKMAQFTNPTIMRQMQYMSSVSQKLSENRELQFEDMFRIIDKNGERLVTAPSVLEFFRRIQIQITEHKFIEILVKIKHEQVKNLETCMIDVYQFKEIMGEISIQTMELSLQFLNISKGLLAKSLIMIAIYLFLVIAFILIGVQAFAVPGTFASIVNSILPMIGGLSLNRASAEEKLKALNIERIKDIVRKAVRLIQSARI